MDNFLEKVKTEINLKKILSRGSFGFVVSVDNKICKIEKFDNVGLNEIYIYKQFLTYKKIEQWKKTKNLDFLALPYYQNILFFTLNDIKYSCITLNNYGCSLAKIYYNLFDDLIFIKIYINLLQAIEYLHKNNLIHNDIKPSNILVPNINFPERIVLIDFGLSSKSFVKFSSFIGTKCFASINAHKQTYLSFKDDLESLGYTLLFLIYKKSIWSRNIYESKKKFRKVFFDIINGLCLSEDIKLFLIKYFSYIYSLHKFDYINYYFLLNLF